MILAKLASLIFPSILSIGQNILADSVSDGIKTLQFENNDNRIRQELIKKIDDFDYDSVDAFFSGEQLYSSSYLEDELTNAQLDALVEKYFSANIDHIPNKLVLEPLIRKAAKEAHDYLISKLSVGERILHKQLNDHDTKTLNEFAKIDSKLEQILKQSQTSVISGTEAKEFYRILQACFLSGNIEVISDFLNLFPADKIRSDSIFYLYALRLQVDFLINGRLSRETILEFLSYNPSEHVLNDLITFFFQFQYYDFLSEFIPYIDSQSLKDLISIALSNDLKEKIKMLLSVEYVIQPEYREHLAALWFAAHLECEIFEFNVAAQSFSLIFDKTQNVWADYYSTYTRIQNLIKQHESFILESDDLQNSVIQLLIKCSNYQGMFSLCNKTISKPLLTNLFLAASYLRRDNFVIFSNSFEESIKNEPFYKSADYRNQMQNNLKFDTSTFYDFCDETSNLDLFLFHIVLTYESLNYQEVYIELSKRREWLRANSVLKHIYIHSILALEGKRRAIDELSAFEGSYCDSVEYKVLAADILGSDSNNQIDTLLNEAYAQFTEPGIKMINLPTLLNLTRLMEQNNRNSDAIKLLSTYSSSSLPLMFEQLRLLMKTNAPKEECDILIDKLLEGGFEHPLIYQFRGSLKEKKLQGSGLSDFEKSFKLLPSIESAYHILVVRLLVSKSIDDKVLAFACKTENPQLSYVAAQVYQKLHSPDLESFYILKALLETNEAYDEKIYGYFFMLSVQHESEKKKKPTKVQENVVVTLKSIKDNTISKICFHSESMLIPINGSLFAGCSHTDCNDSLYLKMKYRQTKNTVLWHGEPHEIVNIEDRISHFAKFCVNRMIENKSVETISAGKPQELVDKISEFELERSKGVEQTLDQYSTSRTSLPLHAIAARFGKTDFDIIKHLLLSDKPFLSGIYDLDCSPPYILTLSTMYLLGLLGISSLPESCKSIFLVSFFTAKRIEAECEAVCKNAEFTTAVIWADANSGHFFNYDDDFRASIHSQIADIRSLLDSCIVLDELEPENYIDELAQINDDIGRDSYESISIAKTKSYSLICDDICIRRIANGFGVNSTNVIDVMVMLELDFTKVIEFTLKLLKMQFQFPITLTLLNYFALQYDLLQEAGDSTDSITKEITTLFDLVSENPIFWMNFLNQTWAFARQDTPRNMEITRIVFKYALVISAKVDHLELIPVLNDNTNNDE